MKAERRGRVVITLSAILIGTFRGFPQSVEAKRWTSAVHQATTASFRILSSLSSCHWTLRNLSY